MTRQEAAKLVAVIMAAVPSQSRGMSPEQARDMASAYADLLSDLSYEQANAALRVLLQTRTWMPSVADIRATALELQRGPVAPGGEQWGSVLRAIREQGIYRTPGVDFTFRDSITARCVQALGWSELCNSENAVADRARFVELYDKLAAQSHREAQSPALSAAKEQRAIGETQGVVLSLAEKLGGAS